MSETKEKLTDRFARWAGMGQNGRDMDNGTAEDVAMTEAPEGAVDLEAGTEGAAQVVEENAAQAAELEQLRGERDAMKDRLARLQAEFENARRRETKEKQDARDYATQNAVEPFLGVLDNFALALKAQGSVEQLRAGVELIVKQMEEALRGLNVVAVESVGAEFDPRVHEALGSVETLEHPDHTVLEEIRRGYKLRDKLLRPALVKIAVNTAQRSE
jgi:molecular chaperone GrpE